MVLDAIQSWIVHPANYRGYQRVQSVTGAVT